MDITIVERVKPRVYPRVGECFKVGHDGLAIYMRVQDCIGHALWPHADFKDVIYYSICIGIVKNGSGVSVSEIGRCYIVCPSNICDICLVEPVNGKIEMQEVR